MLLVMALLISGAQILARGPTKFPARGKMVEITLADGSGRKHQVHVRCDGPKNASFPVILMESDGSHGMLDFVALQMQFTANGRRSCIWDKPGLGYSDVRYAKRDDAEQFLPPLIDALGEQPPYILLGWGGGGPTVYQYATTAPQNVHSLVFLEAYPNDVEFLVEQRLNNLTNDATAAKRSVDLTGRRVLMGIINFIGIPLGLMPIIIPPANTTPPSLGAEVQWYMLADKTWTNQQFYLKESAAASMFAPSVFEQHALAPHIPIHTIAQVWSDDQARRIQCTSTDTSTDCANKVRRNQLYLDYKLGLLQYSGNRSASVMVNCTMDECTQATLVWWMPQYTATAVEHIYAGVSL
ncbi:TPA: hypothetical protein N0F65_002120 [Lagenidium giganteum]|uniref:AB hydrolase-1 domain-containing protein n=1 Tax=Lagenidium giganteum TaxID=4803 RepID=A0AAV2ZBJ5_9STRA|nr:TPA: hypothetical protein N0F65_002120 [Lagenidium giganteum]